MGIKEKIKITEEKLSFVSEARRVSRPEAGGRAGQRGQLPGSGGRPVLSPARDTMTWRHRVHMEQAGSYLGLICTVEGSSFARCKPF